MVKNMYLTDYWLDDSIDVLFIDFDGITSGGYGVYDLPDDVKSELWIKGTVDHAHHCEIVSPQEFINSSLTNIIIINGMNLK